jgi:hypothetical protein
MIISVIIDGNRNQVGKSVSNRSKMGLVIKSFSLLMDTAGVVGSEKLIEKDSVASRLVTANCKGSIIFVPAAVF